MILFVFVLLIISSIVSAGFFSWFKKTIGGYATSQNENVTVSVSGQKNVTVVIYNYSNININPTENNYTNVTIYVTLTDGDGVSDINTTSVRANFSREGEVLRSNSSCAYIGNINSTTANFSCNVDMWYFDAAGAYNVTAGGTDLGSTLFVYNYTVLQYTQLQAFAIAPTSGNLTFPTVSTGAVNQTANNDPTIINNTGNYNVSLGNLQILGVDLLGQVNSSQAIFAGNFTVGNNTGGTPGLECGNTTATRLFNNSYIAPRNTSLPRGNRTINDGNTGQEYFYYCLTNVPTDISSQTYSTIGGGAWIIKIV